MNKKQAQAETKYRLLILLLQGLLEDKEITEEEFNKIVNKNIFPQYQKGSCNDLFRVLPELFSFSYVRDRTVSVYSPASRCQSSAVLDSHFHPV